MPWLSRAPPAALTLVRPRPPCISTYGLGRGADLASGARLASCSLCWFSRKRGQAPRASLTLVAAPQVWWASWRRFERRGSRGQPHEAHCRSRSALAQNTNAQQVTCLAPLRGAAPQARGACYTFCTTCNKKPTSGGQRRRRGGLVTRSAKPLAGGVSSLSA